MLRFIATSRLPALCAALLLIPTLSVAAVIRVPGDEPAVDSALLSAAPYDTVLVAPGTHFVNINWPATPGIKLVSESGVHTTFLDGRNRGVVITITSGVDSTTVIRGFSIRNGVAQVLG